MNIEFDNIFDFSICDNDDTSDYAKASDLTSHIDNTSNPHKVTADQVGADPSGSASSALTSAKAYTDDTVADMVRRADSGEFDGYTPVKGKDYFTTAEIQQIQNEVSSGAIGEFNTVVDTETDKFNANVTQKLNAYNGNAENKVTEYNQNDTNKTAEYNSNAETKLNEYNINANNRITEFDAHTEQIQTDISELKSEQSVQSARMDTFTSLPEGSTSGNAELADIRVGADGKTYDTAGNAVRGQIGELKSDLDNYFYKELLNAWDKDNRIDGKFYTSSGGALSESALWCYSETYVEIKPNTSYEAKYKTSSGEIQNAITSICFYDSNKNFIEHQFDIHPSVSPQNAKYVRISVRTTYTNEFVFSEKYNGDKPFGYLYALKDDVYIKKLDEIEKGILKANPLYGKVLCCVGDSITYGADMDTDGITNDSNITVYNSDADGNFTETTGNFLKTYGWQIASRNHMTFYNGGVSGSVIASVQSRHGFSLENGRYTKLPENIDYLTIWFGWNDYAEITSESGLETLGSLSDTDTTTYYGAYNTILDYLTSHYPYTKICVCVPFGANGDIRNATREVANYWGVACWDNTEKNTPLYYNKEHDVTVKQEALDRNRAKFQALGAHPNFKGHTQISHMLEHFLRGI